jgi:phage terminase small subunit
MAGVKGKSGGARTGAGRKAKPPADIGVGDAKEFLERIVRGEIIANAQQLDAAKALLPYQHKKLGEAGKKELRKDEAGKVAGRFSPGAPPRLVAADGKRV